MKLFAVLTSAVLFSASFVGAEEIAVATADSAKVCDAKCASTCSGGCPIEAAMAKLPKMTYQVGKESTCCAQSAAKLAKDHDAPIKFVVADKTYETKNVAMVALADATEAYVKGFATPKTCSVSGKTTVAGKELCCDVMAGMRAKVAKEAMAKVNMTYMVGEKECHCPTEASTLAKTSGAEKYFVVGKEKTCCNTTARITLAHAKYKAAVEALAKADASAADQS